MKTERLFIALPLPAQIVNKVASAAQKLFGATEDARRVPKDNLHITLKFLGDMPTEQLPLIISVLEAVAADQSSLTVKLNHGLLIPKQNPRTAGIGIDRSDELSLLFDSLETKLAEANISNREHRSFNPHITIARFRTKLDDATAEAVVNFSDLRDIDFEIFSMVLFQSELRPQGPVYHQLTEVGFV